MLKPVAGILQFLRYDALAGQKQRVRHFSKRQAQRKGGNRQDRRSVQCTSQFLRKLRIRHRLRTHHIHRSRNRRKLHGPHNRRAGKAAQKRSDRILERNPRDPLPARPEPAAQPEAERRHHSRQRSAFLCQNNPQPRQYHPCSKRLRLARFPPSEFRRLGSRNIQSPTQRPAPRAWRSSFPARSPALVSRQPGWRAAAPSASESIFFPQWKLRSGAPPRPLLPPLRRARPSLDSTPRRTPRPHLALLWSRAGSAGKPYALVEPALPPEPSPPTQSNPSLESSCLRLFPCCPICLRCHKNRRQRPQNPLCLQDPFPGSRL